jgi:hypothetical protein
MRSSRRPKAAIRDFVAYVLVGIGWLAAVFLVLAYGGVEGEYYLGWLFFVALTAMAFGSILAVYRHRWRSQEFWYLLGIALTIQWGVGAVILSAVDSVPPLLWAVAYPLNLVVLFGYLELFTRKAARAVSPPPIEMEESEAVSVEVIDEKGNPKGGLLALLTGIGGAFLWTRFDGGWLLLASWILLWVGSSCSIRGSAIVRYAGGGLASLVILGLVATRPASSSGRNAGSDSGLPSLASTPVVTMAEFNRLRVGMSYEEVVRVVGAQGELMSSSDLATNKTVVYSWENDDASNMNATFRGDEMIQKEQFRLE